jgi:hypothetical protein
MFFNINILKIIKLSNTKVINISQLYSLRGKTKIG